MPTEKRLAFSKYSNHNYLDNMDGNTDLSKHRNQHEQLTDGRKPAMSKCGNKY